MSLYNENHNYYFVGTVGAAVLRSCLEVESLAVGSGAFCCCSNAPLCCPKNPQKTTASATPSC